MLDHSTRSAILKLAALGHGKQTIARVLGVSRNSVKRVLSDGRAVVPGMQRRELLDEHLEQVRKLHGECKGNLVRVHEKLSDANIGVSYSALTGFCRRHKIGTKPKKRAGQYHFGPGEEMQHDTSPHDVEVGERKRRLQCASLVLCYSRKIYAQCYPQWTRFECRHFLSEAFEYMGAVAGRCMIDNSSVIIASGTGKDAVAAPAMQAFADRFDFNVVAHEVGDADRSGRVERPFDHIDNNFYAGRTFTDLQDLNRQFVQWCDRKNSSFHKGIRAIPNELFVAEHPALKPLPLHIPEVYRLHSRRVGVEGFVNLHTNRYSVDDELIGLQLEVRETIDKLYVFHGHKLVETHDKLDHGLHKRVILEQHRLTGRWTRKNRPQTPDEQLLRAQGPQLVALIDALQKHHGGRALRYIRQLHRLWRDYPTPPLLDAIGVALEFGLTDIGRIETMVLRRIAGDLFRLPVDPEDNDG